jgi:hypothetical protein
MLKSKLKIGVAVLAASALFYSCTQDQNTSTESEAFTETDADFDALNIEGQYIVVFQNGAVDNVSSKYPNNYTKAQEAMFSETKKFLSEASVSAEIVNVYSNALSGATLKLDKAQLEVLKNKKGVKYIEQDRIVTFAPPCGTPTGLS